MDNGTHNIFNRQIIAEYKINERAINQQLIFKLKKKYKIMRERVMGQETEIRVKSKEEKNNVQKNTPQSTV